MKLKIIFSTIFFLYSLSHGNAHENFKGTVVQQRYIRVEFKSPVKLQESITKSTKHLELGRYQIPYSDWEMVDSLYGIQTNDPFSSTYRSIYPAFEPETKTVIKVIETYKPKVVFDYHWMGCITGNNILSNTLKPEVLSELQKYAECFYHGFYENTKNPPRNKITESTMPGTTQRYCVTKHEIPAFSVEGNTQDPVLNRAFHILEVIATKNQPDYLKSLFEKFIGINEINIPEYLESDQQFHNMIMKISGNQIPNRLELSGNNTIRTFRSSLLQTPLETEHLAIIAALEKGDGELVEKLISNHTHKSLETLRET